MLPRPQGLQDTTSRELPETHGKRIVCVVQAPWVQRKKFVHVVQASWVHRKELSTLLQSSLHSHYPRHGIPTFRPFQSNVTTCHSVRGCFGALA